VIDELEDEEDNIGQQSKNSRMVRAMPKARIDDERSSKSRDRTSREEEY
jgi:hypothetical protein